MAAREPEMFQGGRAAFRDACRRLVYEKSERRTAFNTRDADALFDLIDVDKDGLLSRRELLDFVRDRAHMWSRQAGLTEMKLEYPHDCEKVDVRYGPLLQSLVAEKIAPRNGLVCNRQQSRWQMPEHHKRLRAVVSRIRGWLEEQDGSRLRRSLIEPLYNALERVETQNKSRVRWNDFVGVLRKHGVLHVASPDDMRVLRDEYVLPRGSHAENVVDWRAFLATVSDSQCAVTTKDEGKSRSAYYSNPTEKRVAHSISKRRNVEHRAASAVLNATEQQIRRAGRKHRPATNVNEAHAIAKSLRRVFKDADVNRDGYLSKTEIRRLLAGYAKHGVSLLRARQLDLLFDSLDANADGRVSYEEFLKFLLRDLERRPTTAPL